MNVIIWNEKHGPRITRATTAAMLQVFNERYKADYYDNWEEENPKTEWADRARAIHNSQNENAAKNFIYERREHEYEGFEIEPVE